MKYRAAMGHHQVGLTPKTGVIRLKEVTSKNKVDLSPVVEGVEATPVQVAPVRDLLEPISQQAGTPSVEKEQAVAGSSGVMTEVAKGKEPEDSGMLAAQKKAAELLGKTGAGAVTMVSAPKASTVAQGESSVAAQVRVQLLEEGHKARTGDFNREMLKRTGGAMLAAPTSANPTGPAVHTVQSVSSLPSAVGVSSQPAAAATTNTSSAPAVSDAMMTVLQNLQQELSSMRQEVSSIKGGLGGGGRSGALIPKRPVVSRYGKKEGLDAFGVHVSNPHHFESSEAERGIDWLGFGNADAHSTRPDRVKALIGSASVFQNKSGVDDYHSPGVPKENRFEEYMIALSLYWHSVLTDGQSTTYSEADSFHRVIGRYAIAVCNFIIGTKRAGMSRYTPNWDWAMTWRYLKVLVTEEFQGAPFDSNNEMHLYLLSLVPEEKIQSMEGHFVTVVNDDLLAAANKAINDRFMRAAGLLEGSYVTSTTTARGDTESTRKATKDLLKRPMGHCLICWEPKSVCKGYGEKVGYNCVNKFHPRNVHHECGKAHVWEKLGGPRCTPCGADEPWPLPSGQKKAQDKK